LRFVLDVNVLASGLLSRTGPPSQLLERWLAGDFELIVSEQLLAELERTLGYAKIRKHITPDDAAGFLNLLRSLAEIAATPSRRAPAKSEDPKDDYLIALAAAERARLVSGDEHLRALIDLIPVLSPREALGLLD
jgi:putative PIN family toxin of toxin-antitoxin system